MQESQVEQLLQYNKSPIRAKAAWRVLGKQVAHDGCKDCTSLQAAISLKRTPAVNMQGYRCIEKVVCWMSNAHPVVVGYVVFKGHKHCYWVCRNDSEGREC